MNEFITLTRPRTLVAALSPIILGSTFSAYAIYSGIITPKDFNLTLAIVNSILIFIAVVSAQIIANLWNEYCDYKSGLDAKQKVGNAGSITKGHISPSAIMRMIKILILLPLLIGIYLSLNISLWYFPAGAFCILISFLYSGGPKPISRTPFGELASGVAMGLAIVLIEGFTWLGELNGYLIIPALPSTLFVGSIMLTNNIRDYANDRDHGRKTLPIVLGRQRAIDLQRFILVFNNIWLASFVVQGLMAPWTLLGLMSLIPGFKMVHTLNTYSDVYKLDSAMGLTAKTSIAYHFLWSIGMVIALVSIAN